MYKVQQAEYGFRAYNDKKEDPIDEPNSWTITKAEYTRIENGASIEVVDGNIVIGIAPVVPDGIEDGDI